VLQNFKTVSALVSLRNQILVPKQLQQTKNLNSIYFYLSKFLCAVCKI
jgi:hypothetical protein